MDIEPRVNQLEKNHTVLATELIQMNKTLSKIEIAIEKQNEIHADIRTVNVKLDSYIVSDSLKFDNLTINTNESIKRQTERINVIESNINRVVWIIMSTVIVAILGLIIKSSIGI